MTRTFAATVHTGARRLAKAAIATALCRTRADVTIASLFHRMPLVVGYHRVVDDFEREARRAMPGMLVSRAMLERHLDWIGRRHRFISLDELGCALERGERFSRPVAAITFDDGYRDVYENAFPLLLRKGIPAAVFVVSDLVGTRCLQGHDRLYLLLTHAADKRVAITAALEHRLSAAAVPAPQRERLARMTGDPLALTLALLTRLARTHLRQLLDDLDAEIRPNRTHDDGLLPMSWEMLAEMHAKGITIGSHTCSHALLANEPPDVRARETAGSRRRLERQLGAPVAHFAYPNGSFNAAAVRAVAASGYRFAYGACAHRDRQHPLLTIPRVLLWERSSVDAAGRFAPTILNCQLQGFLTGPCGCRRRSHR